ncbi:MAG: threonine synthase [Deltaproteobacteria bacterium]|jgi:threonine synthase|nr:threonine synthase [Deltaproteobacteria bacterium]
MKPELFPEDIRASILPEPGGDLRYDCLRCGGSFPPDALHYVCPECGGLLLLEDHAEARLRERDGAWWRRLFDHRLMANDQALRGVFCYHEFLAPIIPLEDVVYLGEAHTPAVKAPPPLEREVGASFYVKLDGLNPSASFKDRGMAAALSFVRYLARTRGQTGIMAVCASTGDTSAAAALYSASLGGIVKAAVLLPRGYVTPQQLSQPLGAGAGVFELPGVFDDCMKVVEKLSEDYEVVLLNSKNPWRVLGQESYAFEVAQQFDWETGDLMLFVPVGNAGNITAVLGGLMKLHRAGVIGRLPRVTAVQSERANPVFSYYSSPPSERSYEPVKVRPSVAQAAMIGDPVSFPRLARLAARYEEARGPGAFQAVEVTEQQIMDSMILANRSGLTVCTQGGESLAGLRKAIALGLVSPGETAVLDSTAHALKFMEFQNAYFRGDLAGDYGVQSRPENVNAPRGVELPGIALPAQGKVLTPGERAAFTEAAALAIASELGLSPKT